MGRKQESAQGPAAWRVAALVALPVTALAVLGVLVVVMFNRIESFLVEDPRFALRPPRHGRGLMPDVHVKGIVRVPPERIHSVFMQDSGRSVYLLPMARRRDALRTMSWVKDASVSRMWPNQVEVRIFERTPVAVAQLPVPGRAGVTRPVLVDADGVLLEAPKRVIERLPVVRGLREDQTQETRRERVERMLEVLSDIGEEAAKISEIDVTDPANLRTTLRMEDRAFVLVLGGDRFHQRIATFFKYYPEIRRRMPEAYVLDMRLEDRIAVVKQE
jgi:cell division protein FtsQ